MRVPGRRKSVVFFIAFGVTLVCVAVGLNVGWILLTPRQVFLLVIGIVLFALIIAGLILNTIFLVREIRRNEAHDSFINAVTHELKTPLASIRLYLETLQTRDLPEAKRAEFYRIMLADNDRLLNTVEQVLRAGSINHKRRPFSLTQIDLPALIEDIIAQIRTRAPALEPQALSFTNTARRSVFVRGEMNELRAAFSNLIDNAIKYSTARVQIEVTLETRDDKILVRVRDTGIGIPQPELKRIFKRFHRVASPAAARVKGTGLGLFIVRAVIKKHHGRITASSEGANRGSTFTIELPIFKYAREDLPNEREFDVSLKAGNADGSSA